MEKKQSRWLRRAVWGVVVALGVVALGITLRPHPLAVETRAARRGPLQVTVDGTGRARVKDRYVISAPLGGNLSRIELRPGDKVEAGAILARIVPVDPPLLDARTRAEAEARANGAAAAELGSRSAIARAELASQHASKELEDTRKLVASGTLSKDAAEHAELEDRVRKEELTSTRFAAQVAQNDAMLARTALSRLGSGRATEQFEISAPIGGQVLRVIHPDGGVVAPGTPLIELGDPGALEIVSDVLTADAVRLPSAAHVTVDRWGGDALRAHVRLIEPSAFARMSALGIEEQRVNVVIDLDEPRAKWERLGDGFRVEVHIVAWESADALLVPQGTTFRSGDDWAVFVMEDGRARLRKVTVGQRGAHDVEVLDGLAPGTLTLLHPSERVTDGLRIEAAP